MERWKQFKESSTMLEALFKKETAYTLNRSQLESDLRKFSDVKARCDARRIARQAKNVWFQRRRLLPSGGDLVERLLGNVSDMQHRRIHPVV